MLFLFVCLLRLCDKNRVQFEKVNIMFPIYLKASERKKKNQYTSLNEEKIFATCLTFLLIFFFSSYFRFIAVWCNFR